MGLILLNESLITPGGHWLASVALSATVAHGANALQRRTTGTGQIHMEASGDDDPLELRRLAVSYDYLVFKIKDRMAALIEETERAVVLKEQAVEEEYLGQKLAIGDRMEQIEKLNKRCDELEAEFARLEQLYVFVDDFKARLAALKQGFAAVNTQPS